MNKFALKNFRDFINSAYFSWFKVDQIFSLHSFEHGEFRSVEISKLSTVPCMISELHAFIFLTVCVNSIMIYLENFRFLYFKKL